MTQHEKQYSLIAAAWVILAFSVIYAPRVSFRTAVRRDARFILPQEASASSSSSFGLAVPVVTPDTSEATGTAEEALPDPEPPVVVPALPYVVEGSSTFAFLRTPNIAELMRRSGDPPHAATDTRIRVPVLMYHHIRPIDGSVSKRELPYTVDPRAFEAQMKTLLADGFEAITPDDLTNAIHGQAVHLPAKPMLVTFDDAYVDQFRFAFPILQRLHLKVTLFIPSGLFGRMGHFSTQQLALMDATGLITVAAHSRLHPDLRHIPLARAWSEIQGSRQDLQALTGQPVHDFAYPYGSRNSKIVDLVKRAGFTDGFGVRWGSLHVPEDLFYLRRIQIFNNENLVPVLEAYLTNRVHVSN